ncbi:hypothetical protein L1S32_05210 [Methanogenium sp. S4BF]|uniref:hypothetical protein n=1 Tax=Methanogenium sp. S4BF TaxID=1789226 RepID=UPI0024179B79|nr:hypothetical protein [Methanogenium sp. S4BF]WFN35503.1 hypothetical protein L1S32_05210 [Methanogenium sp. S4BF]
MGFLDKLLGRSVEPEETEFVFGEIPAWLAEKERAIHEEADNVVRESRPRVCAALREMQETVDALKGAKPDENVVLHPKLLRVVEQGVPRYAAAMEKTLALSVSEVPGEYYDDCIELISQIAKNTKGPGRYIANVFPAQMKEIRLQTDVIGREINALSGVLSQSREQSAWVDAAAETHALLLTNQNQLREVQHTASHMAEENEALAAELSALKHDLQALMEGSEAMEYDELIARQAVCGGKLHEADADYKRILSRSANVFRKAVHICELSGDTETLELLKTVRNGLESPSSAERARGLAAYPSLFPRLARMISESDTLIKNKDEQALFSEQDAFLIPLTEAIARTEDLHAESAAVADALGDLLYVGKKAGMEEKIKKLNEQIVRNAAQINDIQDITDEIRASAPEMAESLRLNLEHLAGEGVHVSLIQVPDFS